VNATDIQATLEYLVPGFVALKVFYVVGLRTRRSDFGWTVLSIATAAALNALAAAAGITDAASRVIIATIVGVVIALVAGAVWRWITRRYVQVKAWFDRQAWDAIWSRPVWVQVWVRDGPIILGAPTVVSESAETDDQDVYLSKPSWIDRVSGERQEVTGVVGIWVSARDIQLVQVLDPNYRPPSKAHDESRGDTAAEPSGDE
jgi:hypothetical protein